MSAPLVYFRRTLLRRLKADTLLQGYLGDNANNPLAIIYRMARETVAVPGIAFFDFGTRPDATVPLHNRRMQVDLWHTDADLVEEMAVRADQVLREAGPVTHALFAAHLRLLSDRDNLVPEGSLTRKTLEYVILAYERAETGLYGDATITIATSEPSLA